MTESDNSVEFKLLPTTNGYWVLRQELSGVWGKWFWMEKPKCNE